jgi:hypothetical protein
MTVIPLETLSVAELTTLELLELTQPLTAHTHLLTEETFAEFTVMLIALWEEPVATQPTVTQSKDLLTCTTLVKLDASTFAPPFSL